MAFVYSPLTKVTPIPDSVGTIYETPGLTTAYLRTIILFNSNTTNETVKLYYLDYDISGPVTPAVTNQFLERVLSPKETLVIEFSAIPGLVLQAGDIISGDTDTADKVTIQLMGSTQT